jgi:NAD(P)H-nitrite reductase large subunit
MSPAEMVDAIVQVTREQREALAGVIQEDLRGIVAMHAGRGHSEDAIAHVARTYENFLAPLCQRA